MFIQKNKTDNAISIHEIDTQGESRSPILAAFQNIPRSLQEKQLSLVGKCPDYNEICCIIIPGFVSVQYARHERMNVSTGANDEEDDNEKRLKVEDCRLQEKRSEDQSEILVRSYDQQQNTGTIT